MLGIRSPRFVRALDPEIITVQTHAVRVDGLLEDPTGTVWLLEFETGTADPWRTIRHHVAVRDVYPGRAVETVVFWGQRKSPKRLFTSGNLSLGIQEVLLARRHAGPLLRRLEARVARGEPLTPEDGFLRGLVPLMENSAPLPAVVAQGIALAQALPPDIRAPVLESMQAVAYSRGDETDRARIREVLRTMPLPLDLYRDLRKESREEGREEGRLEGELRQAREAVLEAFAAHFDAVPDTVKRAVSQAEDRDQLHGWHRAVIRARDEAEAERAVLNGC